MRKFAISRCAISSGQSSKRQAVVSISIFPLRFFGHFFPRGVLRALFCPNLYLFGGQDHFVPFFQRLLAIHPSPLLKGFSIQSEPIHEDHERRKNYRAIRILLCYSGHCRCDKKAGTFFLKHLSHSSLSRISRMGSPLEKWGDIEIFDGPFLGSYLD